MREYCRISCQLRTCDGQLTRFNQIHETVDALAHDRLAWPTDFRPTLKSQWFAWAVELAS